MSRSMRFGTTFMEVVSYNTSSFESIDILHPNWIES